MGGQKSDSGLVFLASDHAGYKAKSVVASELDLLAIPYKDLGTYSTESVDYPDFAVLAAKQVLNNPGSSAVIICGTGIGISISANKIQGIRAALCTGTYQAEMSRRHNDANILALGGRVSGETEIREILRVWFSTGFEGGRHKIRVEKIHSLTGC